MPTRARWRKGGRKATATWRHWYSNLEQHPCETCSDSKSGRGIELVFLCRGGGSLGLWIDASQTSKNAISTTKIVRRFPEAAGTSGSVISSTRGVLQKDDFQVRPALQYYSCPSSCYTRRWFRTASRSFFFLSFLISSVSSCFVLSFFLCGLSSHAKTTYVGLSCPSIPDTKDPLVAVEFKATSNPTSPQTTSQKDAQTPTYLSYSLNS